MYLHVCGQYVFSFLIHSRFMVETTPYTTRRRLCRGPVGTEDPQHGTTQGQGTTSDLNNCTKITYLRPFSLPDSETLTQYFRTTKTEPVKDRERDSERTSLSRRYYTRRDTSPDVPLLDYRDRSSVPPRLRVVVGVLTLPLTQKCINSGSVGTNVGHPVSDSNGLNRVYLLYK